MRAGKRSRPPKPEVVLGIANHAAMGVALGLAFALVVTTIPFFGVAELIRHSDAPRATMEMFLGVVSTMFGIGAALTGFILMIENN